MRRLRYVSGTGSMAVEMDGPSTYSGTAAGIRGREWAYSIGYRSLAGASRPARECSLSVAFADGREADHMRRLADRDMLNGTPGRLVADGWEQRCYISKSDVAAVFGGFHSAELTVVLLDGVWRRGHTLSFERSASAEGGDFLDLPYDLPYDLGPRSASGLFSSSEWGEHPVRLVVHGPCANPAVRIDGNVHRVDVAVYEGCRLVVDPLARTVSVVDRAGGEFDVFPAAHRGEGLGSGEYIFEPAGPGRHEVGWDGSFRFDLTWYEEEGEPPWS